MHNVWRPSVKLAYVWSMRFFCINIYRLYKTCAISESLIADELYCLFELSQFDWWLSAQMTANFHDHIIILRKTSEFDVFSPCTFRQDITDICTFSTLALLIDRWLYWQRRIFMTHLRSGKPPIVFVYFPQNLFFPV